MSFITAQQTKHDLELVPKEKRLDIGKCNGRLNLGMIQREPTFQVVLDALTLTPCYSAFLITADVPKVYMHQFWDLVYRRDTFYRFKIDKRKRFKLTMEIFRDIFKICPRVQGQDFDALPTDEEIVSFLRDLGHTKEIHSLNDVVVDQMHQPLRTFVALINRSYLEIQLIDNKAYKKQEKMYYPRFTKVIIHHFLTQDKTVSWRNKIRMHTFKDDYLINTLRFVSAKEETQIYDAIHPESLASPEMKETKAYKTYFVSTEEPTGNSKRVKRPAKKSTKALERGVVIRETHEMPLSKKKEKSIRDFHKTHPSGSSAVKIIPSVISEGTDVKPGVLDVTEEESSESEAESWGNDKDNNNNEQDSSGEDSDQKNDSDDYKIQSDNENEFDSEHETDENESGSELNEPVDTDKGFVQEEGSDAAMTNVQQGNENLEILQVIKDAHVISDSSPVFPTVIPQSLPSFTPSPQQSIPTPPPITVATNPQSALPNFASVFHFNNRVTTLEKEVTGLKKDPFHTQVTALVDGHLDARMGATREEFMNFLSASLTARITEQVKNQLP
ncbi:hypothetical protein Tco_0010678 [Tanacetum coccineum]